MKGRLQKPSDGQREEVIGDAKTSQADADKNKDWPLC